MDEKSQFLDFGVCNIKLDEFRQKLCAVIILQRTLPSKKLPSAGQDSRKFADWYDWNNAHCGFFPYIQKYYDTTVYLAFFCCYISNERHWEAVQPLFSLGSRTTPFSLGSRTTPFFIGKPYNPFFHWEAVQPLFSLGNRTTPFFIGNCNKN